MHNRRNWNLRKTIYTFFKRIIDIIISLFIIVVFSPLMIILAIAIKIDSKGPAIFKQNRTGKYGKEFNIWKFRTMHCDNDVRDFSKEDKHTKVGFFLRKTSLDELPQFFCILFGKMSLIGPRPWIPEYYENMSNEQKHRTDVTPGLTGLAQCKGRNSIDIFQKIDYDLEYIDNYSLWQDIKIIFLTVKTLFESESADAGKSNIKKEIEDLKKKNKK